MKGVGKILFENGVNKYRFKTILFIALLWACIDTIAVLTFNTLPGKNKIEPLLLREAIVFIMSLVMGYLLVVSLKKLFRNYSLWLAYLIKSFILVCAAIIMYLLLYTVNSVTILGVSLKSVFSRFYYQMFHPNTLFQKTIYWIILFIATQLIIEINEKYSPGVFLDIFLGKYIHPKTEKRIIMFIDLKDSTSIAEKLDSKKYFRFIREFIYQVSTALIEYGGIIYQYVGDEVVLTWQIEHGLENSNCLKFFFMFQESLLSNKEDYLKNFGVKPEFKAGLHFGKVTSAQIGDIKREIVYNGDVVNTTARIQNECNKYQRNLLVSGILMNRLKQVNSFQWERVDAVTLRGKEKEMELFSVVSSPRNTA